MADISVRASERRVIETVTIELTEDAARRLMAVLSRVGFDTAMEKLHACLEQTVLPSAVAPVGYRGVIYGNGLEVHKC